VSDRFYFAGPLGPGDVNLDGPEAHHLTAVRRFGPGDAITLFNGDGHEYSARVVEVGKKRVMVQVTAVLSPERELEFPLHIGSALPKSDRGDFLIEKLTELGVTDFTPLLTERGVVRPDASKAEKLRRAVIEASKQCGRNVLMRVHAPASWLDWCRLQTGHRLIAHLDQNSHRFTPAVESVIVAVGPEGGFTESEVDVARRAGWEQISLGPSVLRVETAALMAAVLFGRTSQ
jgi:16S rRNA (uracil1498-N3)-methyltransferase